mgnify:FL=1
MITRSSGVLMPVSALPTSGGIGTLGIEAFRFADWLKKSGQRYWQVLPIGPQGKADSPYQPLSAFAGCELYIDLERLFKDGLLFEYELPQGESRYVNYAAVRRERMNLLRLAFSRFSPDEKFTEFCKDNASWLDGYANFAAIRRQYNGAPLAKWKTQDRVYSPSVIERWGDKIKEDADFYKFCQYRFMTDWDILHKYCANSGVQIVGDLPIYVSPDGADVWSYPEQFQLDADYKPSNIAGVPPDAFSETGQRWENPLYDWERMADSDFSWWKMRIYEAAKMFDAVRIDHFIGFARYYSIPADSETAINGRWRRGPGRKLIDAINSVRGDMDIIAENLGVLHPSVCRLLDYTGYHGMNVMEFAFGDEGQPFTFSKNSVVYGATHDNDTLLGWFNSLDEQTADFVSDYIGAKSKSGVRDALLRTIYALPCDIAVLQTQDLLWLGSSARMNTPGTTVGNWRWRMSKDSLTDSLAEKLNKYSKLYGRWEK